MEQSHNPCNLPASVAGVPVSNNKPSAAEYFNIGLRMYASEHETGKVAAHIEGKVPYWLPNQESCRKFAVSSVDSATAIALAKESNPLTPDAWLNRIVELGGCVDAGSESLARRVEASEVFPFDFGGTAITLPDGHSVKYEAVWEPTYQRIQVRLSIEGTNLSAEGATVKRAVKHLQHEILGAYAAGILPT